MARKVFYTPFEVSTWFERDRANVRVEDAKGNTILDVWDEDVSTLIEDGFLDSRDIVGSARDYASYLLGFKDYYDLRYNETEVGRGFGKIRVGR